MSATSRSILTWPFAAANALSAERAYEFAAALCGDDGDPDDDVWERFAGVDELADLAWSRDAYRAAQAVASRFGSWATSPDPAVLRRRLSFSPGLPRPDARFAGS
jgi:hypothetical protein